MEKISKFTKFLQKVDSIAPEPWYVEGVKQARPTYQLGFMIGVLIGILISTFLF